MTTPAMTPIHVLVELSAVRHRADSQTPIEVENIPDYNEVNTRGLGAFLQPPPRS